MTIASEIQRIQTNIANAYDAAEAKGATLPAVENTENLASTIESIEAHADPVLQDKVILANGEYTADEGYDGIGTATVAVNAIGATEVATNRTGAAINAGDKVWINQEYYEAGESVEYSNSYAEGNPEVGYSLNDCVTIFDRAVYRSGVVDQQLEYVCHESRGRLEDVYNIQRKNNGIVFSFDKNGTELLGGSKWKIAGYVPILGSDDLLFASKSENGRYPVIKINPQTGVITKRYSLDDQSYPYVYIPDDNSDWNNPVLLPNGDVICHTQNNYNENWRRISLDDINETCSYYGSQTSQTAPNLTHVIFVTSDGKYAINIESVYDLTSINGTSISSTGLLVKGINTSLSSSILQYDPSSDYLLIYSRSQGATPSNASSYFGLYKYNSSTENFDNAGVDLSDIEYNLTGFGVNSSGNLEYIGYLKDYTHHGYLYMDRFLGNNIVNYASTTNDSITGTAAENITLGATGNVYLGDKGALQSKVATSNGTIRPDSDYYGLKSVTVNVVGTGAEVEGKNYTGAVINEGDKVWINPYYYESDEEIYATAPRYSYSSSSSMNNGNYPPIPTPDFHYCFSNYSKYNFYSIIDNSQVGTSSYITSNWSWFRAIEYVNGIQYVFYGENSSGGMQRTDIGLSWSHAKWQPILGDPSFVIDWSGTEDILHKIDVNTGQIINSWNLGYKLTSSDSRARYLGFSVTQDQLVLATATNSNSNALFEMNSDGSVTRTNLNVSYLTMDTFAQTSDKSQIINIDLHRVFDVSNLNDIKTISTAFILGSSTYPGWVNFHTNGDLLVVKKVNYAGNKLDTYRYNISTKSWDLISLDFPGSTHNNIAIDVKGDLSSVLYCSSGSSVTNVTLEEIGGNNLVNFNLVTANTQTGTAIESIAIGNTGTVKVGANITPTLVTKTITENGTYSASSDSADGFSEVTVNVSGSSSEYTCLNSTGSNISEGERVYIAANTNPKLITWASLTSLGYTGIASEDIANGASGKVKAYMKEPHTGTLEQWDRVDGKGTVVGFFTDGNGTEYAVVVADAAYRTGNKYWSNSSSTETPLPNYDSSSTALAATESATFNMDTVRGNYDLSTYPAFNSAYSNTITFDGVTYNGLLPNAAELQMIYTNREYLDTLDTSLVDYPNNSLMTWNIEGNSGTLCWSSNEYNSASAWAIPSTGSLLSTTKTNGRGVIPVFEIPVASDTINSGDVDGYNSGSGGEADEAGNERS